MERLTVRGLIVRETETGEYDKNMTLVTHEVGRITIIGKGVKSIKNRNCAPCQMFAYSRFILRKSRNFWYLEEAELIEEFYDLRYDFEGLALAAYVCEVMAHVSMENSPEPQLLRLALNTLYALNKCGAIPHDRIKAAFELRCACECGFCPDLSACDVCGCEPSGELYLDVMNGRLLCKDCKPRAEKEEEMIEGTARLYYIISKDVLLAMRYIATVDQSKLLSFSLDEDGQYLLSRVTEGYLTNHLEHKFPTLDFYRNVLLMS